MYEAAKEMYFQGIPRVWSTGWRWIACVANQQELVRDNNSGNFMLGYEKTLGVSEMTGFQFRFQLDGWQRS